MLMKQRESGRINTNKAFVMAVKWIQIQPPATKISSKVTVPRLFADLGVERVKEKNDLSSLKARLAPFFSR